MIKKTIELYPDTFKRLSEDRKRGETWDCCIRRLMHYPDEDDEDDGFKCHPSNPMPGEVYLKNHQKYLFDGANWNPLNEKAQT